MSTDRKYGEDIPDEKLFEKLVGATDKRIQELERGKTELLAEVNALTMILAHAKGDNNTLREENAALTQALDEALSVRIKLDGGSSQVVLNMLNGTWGFWDRHNSKNFELSPASRALCEKLFGGGNAS